MKRTALFGFIVGALVPLFWGILSFLLFSGPEDWFSRIYWNAVYITCPFWLIDGEKALILMPLLNGCMYAVIAVLIAEVRQGLSTASDTPPRPAEKKRTVRPYLIAAGMIPLFFACAAYASSGVMTAFGAFGVSPRPKMIGWLIAMLSVGVVVWAMDYWARALPWILGCATLYGLTDVLNQPSVARGHSTAALAMLGLGLTAFLATTFWNRRLTKVDRVACLGIFASFAIIMSPSQLKALAFAGIVTCVVTAWAVERWRLVHHPADSGNPSTLETRDGTKGTDWDEGDSLK